MALLQPRVSIPGWQGSRVMPLSPEQIVRFFTEDRGVCARCVDGSVHTVRLRLHELEQQLDSRVFVRIFSSEIVHPHHGMALNLAFSGTIHLTLAGGDECRVSRRNVRNMKKALGLQQRRRTMNRLNK